MGFGEIYWPVAAALLTVFAITEVFHVSVGFWMHKRHQKKVRAMQADMKAQGADPFMAALFGAGMAPPPGFNPETLSGVPGEGGPDLEGGKSELGGYL